MFWTEPSSPRALQLCLDGVRAKLQVGTKGVLCATGKRRGVPRRWVGSEQPLPSSPG